MAALELAVAVAGNERDRVDIRPREPGDDELGRDGREITPAALLPRGDERARAGVVDERSPRRGEREPPAAALGAAANGPGPGAPQRSHHGGAQRTSRVEAAVADRAADPAADAAAAGEHEVERAASSTDGYVTESVTLRPSRRRLRAESVPRRTASAS